jgi:Fe-S cluster assembly protein SufD
VKHTLKYGLTTALRAFDFPDKWDGAEQMLVQNMHPADLQNAFEKSTFLGTQQDGQHRYFEVPAGASGEIHINRNITGNCGAHRLIRIGQGAHVKIIEEITGEGTVATDVRLIIEKDAHVEFAILQNMSKNSQAFLSYNATISHGTIHWFFCGIGAQTTQAYIGTQAGAHTSVVNNAVLFGTSDQQFDIHVATNHTGPHSKSNMLTRSVLDDQARAVYHGLIHISPEASECDSYQKDEVILLSDQASADAIPNLEIQNHQVRCTHGATIGKMDEEKLFYFLSRGITKQEAKKMITEGFLEPLFIAPWQDKIRS